MQLQKIAEERIEILFNQAEDKFDEHPELSDRYVKIAQKIGERTQTPLKKSQKLKFCSSCETFWRPGANCKVNINPEKSIIEYSCCNCGESEKHGY